MATCVSRVWHGHHADRCGKKAKYEFNGKAFCLTHYPPAVEERQKLRTERAAARLARNEATRKANAKQKLADDRKLKAYPQLRALVRKLADAKNANMDHVFALLIVEARNILKADHEHE